MSSSVEQRVSALESDAAELLGRLPGAPLNIRLQSLQTRIHKSRLATKARFAKIDSRTDTILERLPK
jgi:hypothetical protein